MQKMCWDYKVEKWKMWIWTVKNQSRSDSTKKHTKGAVNCMNPGCHANKYQMNLILRLVSVCIKFPEKCNQNVIVTIKKRSDFWSNLLIISSRDDRI